jgi:hypothetical protein
MIRYTIDELLNAERKLKNKEGNILHVSFQPKQGTNLKLVDGMLFRKHPELDGVYYPAENQPEDDHQFIIVAGNLMKKHPRYPMYITMGCDPNATFYMGMCGDYWCQSERDPDNPEYWIETLQEARLENIDKRIVMVNGNVSFCRFDGIRETQEAVIITGKEKITKRYYVGKEEQTGACITLF